MGTYSLTERLVLSGSWGYSTGNAVTFPSGKYEIDGRILNYYTERNGYRMPDYHRMDVGLTLYNKKFKTTTDQNTGQEIKTKKRFESNWNFSIYNLYVRENAYTISFRQNKDNPQISEAVQLSLFKIIPSMTYNFNF